jgi:hypothetical protein
LFELAEQCSALPQITLQK